MKLSVSSYSFHQKTKTGEMTLFDCITKAKEMGFEAIEFTELPGDSLEAQTTLAAELKTAADTIGLDICAYVVGAKLYQETEEASDAEVKRLFGQVEIAHLLGAKIFRHDVCSSLGKSGNARSFDLMLPTIAKNARRVTEYAQGLGIRTCTENHGTIAQDSDRVERLFNAVHHDNYGLLVDIGNFACVDESSITAVSRTAPYAIHVHIKDMAIRNTPWEEKHFTSRGCHYLKGTVVGEGDIPVRQCLAILKRVGYDDYLSIEYEAAEDCLCGIARGLQNLRSMLEQI